MLPRGGVEGAALHENPQPNLPPLEGGACPMLPRGGVEGAALRETPQPNRGTARQHRWRSQNCTMPKAVKAV